MNYLRIFSPRSALLFLAILTGCGGAHMPLPAAELGNPLTGAKTTSSAAVEVTFEDIKPIFKKSCTACHAPGGSLPNWLDYAVSFQLKDRIKKRVVDKKDMPLGSSLAPAEISLISKWITLGAVEKNVTAEPTPEVTAPVEPPPAPVRCEDAAPRYQGEVPSLEGDAKTQFQRGHAAFVKHACTTCHGNTGRGDGPVAVAFDPKPRNFITEDFKLGSGVKEVFGTITMGFCTMPAYGSTVSDIERMEIATFLAAVRQSDPDALVLFNPPPPPQKALPPKPKAKKKTR